MQIGVKLCKDFRFALCRFESFTLEIPDLSQHLTQTVISSGINDGIKHREIDIKCIFTGYVFIDLDISDVTKERGGVSGLYGLCNFALIYPGAVIQSRNFQNFPEAHAVFHFIFIAVLRML